MIEHKCPKCGGMLICYFNKCEYAGCKCINCGYSNGLVFEDKKQMKKENKIPCSGKMCCMNRNFKPSECVLFDECQFYTPEEKLNVADFIGLEAIIEMTEKEFNITSDVQKNKLRILLNAYAAEYLSIVGGIE